MRGCISQLAQQVGTDCTAFMPQIARYVVTKLGSGLEFGNGCDELQNR